MEREMEREEVNGRLKVEKGLEGVGSSPCANTYVENSAWSDFHPSLYRHTLRYTHACIIAFTSIISGYQWLSHGCVEILYFS